MYQLLRDGKIGILFRDVFAGSGPDLDAQVEFGAFQKEIWIERPVEKKHLSKRILHYYYIKHYIT